MAFFMALILYPILNIIAISLSSDYYVLTSQVSVFPLDPEFDAYKQAFQNKMLLRSYINTITVALSGALCSLVMISLAAYPLAFSDFIGKKLVGLLIVFTLWFNSGMIPKFLVTRNLGLLNTKAGLVFDTLAGAFHIIILRSFFKTIPKSLMESAKIDGANDFRILFHIVWPLSKPALALIALWIIVGHWNAYMVPLLYLNDQKQFTLQIVLRDIVMLASGSLYGIEMGVQTGETVSNSAISEQTKNAVVFIAMFPMLVVYPFLQRYFVKGIMLGAVKE
jgi:putative aldouronate transport system permease protein